jgi:hypothetical protein
MASFLGVKRLLMPPVRAVMRAHGSPALPRQPCLRLVTVDDACGLLALDEQAAVSVMAATIDRAAALVTKRRERRVMTASMLATAR